MGTSDSRVYVDYPELCTYKKVFDILNLSEKEVYKLFKIYAVIDLDHSKLINVHELIKHLGIDRTSFMVRVFSLLDIDRSGEIDFGEFVVALWNYCAMDDKDLVSFTFDLYDNTRSGMLFTQDLQRMIIDIYGKEIERSKHASKLYDKITLSNLHCYDLASFTNFAEQYPALLYPAFLTQRRLRQSILGGHFWRRMTRRRRKTEEVISFRQICHVLQSCKKETQRKVSGNTIHKPETISGGCTSCTRYLIMQLDGTNRTAAASIHSTGRAHEAEASTAFPSAEHIPSTASEERLARPSYFYFPSFLITSTSSKVTHADT